MTPAKKIVLAVIFAIVVFWLVWWFSIVPAHAAECAVTVDAAETRLTAHGGIIVALVNLPALHADQMLIVSFNGAVLALMVKDGCVVSDPIAIDAAVTGT